jgi:hypothetical protein
MQYQDFWKNDQEKTVKVKMKNIEMKIDWLDADKTIVLGVIVEMK